MIWVVALMVLIMLSAAVAVLLVESHISAVAFTSVLSLALSVLFVLLQAPDVAMTEAVVGAGLSTLLLALALRRLGINSVRQGRGDDHNA
jgi:energy-converting hydrogenase B subunit D